MVVEPFRPEHTEAIAAMCVAEGWDFWEGAGRVERALTAPGVTTLVAMESGRVVGVAQVISDGEINWILGLLIVEATSRGQGIGTQLVSAAIARTGARRLDALTEDDGPLFYRRLDGREMSGFRLYPPSG